MATKSPKASVKKSQPKTSRAATEVTAQRKIKQPTYKSFRRSKRIKQDKSQQIPGSFKIMAASFGVIRQNLKLLLLITLIYGFLTIVLVRGVGGGLNLNDIKDSIKEGTNGQYGQLATGAILFSYLLGSSGGSSTAAGGAYQTILMILMSLVIIWSLRQVIAGHKIRVRDAFYRGTYPLVQFILVLLTIGLQLLPLIVGSWLFAAVSSNGIAVTPMEQVIWFILFALLAILSLYMIASSIFALYIVTLPDMTPLKSLRSARALVLHRRWTVLRKVLFLPFALLILVAVIMVPLIMYATPVAEWAFFGLTMFVLVVVHSYMYSLYRDLL